MLQVCWANVFKCSSLRLERKCCLNTYLREIVNCIIVLIGIKSSANALGGVSAVTIITLSLMNIFNKTDAAIFLLKPCYLCCLRTVLILFKLINWSTNAVISMFSEKQRLSAGDCFQDVAFQNGGQVVTIIVLSYKKYYIWCIVCKFSF